MKFIFTTCIVITCYLTSFGQSPAGINYQAVVRDGSNAIVANQNVGIQIQIRTESLVGNIVYSETHSPTTNALGLVNFVIGQGNVESGVFNEIHWQEAAHFAEVLIDQSGGSNYQSMGGQQLMSVPYSFYADTAAFALNGVEGPQGPPGPQGADGIGACEDQGKDSLIALYNNGTAYGYCQDGSGIGQWVVQVMDNTGHEAIGSKKSVVIYSNGNAYAFYRDNTGAGNWAPHTIGGTGHTAAATKDIVVLYNNGTAYAFYVDAGGNGVWVDQTIGGTVHNYVQHGNKIIVYNSGTAYSFSVDDTGAGAWQVQTIGGTGHSVITTN